MKDKHVIELLPDYLDGLLNNNTRNEVEEHLGECGDCQDELKKMDGFLKAFKEEKIAVPSERLKSNFYEMLEQEKQENSKVLSIDQQPNRSFVFLKIAAGIALLIGSFVLGRFLQQQESEKTIVALEDKSIEIKQTAMLSLMENQSASRRIQGVNYIEEFTNPDKAIIKALADRMLYDENTNVRLTAVEALGKFTNFDTVKNAFVTALQTEKDPSIQITIIHKLVEIQEKKAIEPMQRLLEQQETQPFVKQQIESLLPSII